MADPQLSVALGLRLDQFERQMSQAEQLASDGIAQIERTFSGANITLGATIGTALGQGIGAAVGKVIEQLKEFVDRINDIPEAAHRASISVQDLFALQQALGAEGLAPTEVNKGLEKMAALISQSQREATSLSRLFAANGDSLRNAAGQALPLRDVLKQVADYIENAKNGADEIKIAELAGLSDQWAKALRGGGDQLQQTVLAAQDAGVEIKKLIAYAEEFKTAWKSAAVAMGEGIAGAANEFFRRVGLGWDLLKRRLEGESFEDIVGGRRKDAATPVDPDRFLGRRSPIADVTVGGSGGTKIPLSKKPASESENEDEIERLVRSSKRLTDVRTAQIEALGLSNVATQKAVALAKLEAAEREAGRKATTEETAAILAGAVARGNLADAQAKLRKEIELQNFVGNQLVDVFDKLLEGGQKFSDIMADVAKAVRKAALQALILGQGPLAGLFGTTSGTSSPGGAIGGLAGLVKLFSGPSMASGGVVPGSGPVPIIAHGGEVVVPKAVVRQLSQGGGMGGSTYAPQYNIAAGVTAGEVRAYLEAHDRQLARNLPTLLRGSDMRFG